MSSEISTDVPNKLKNLYEKAVSALAATINSFHDTWLEIYGTEGSLNSARVNELEAQILNSFSSLQNNAQDQKNKLIKRGEDVLKEIVHLEKLLGIKEGYSVTHNTSFDIPLMQLDSQLESVLCKYRAEKDERMEKLQTLRTKQETLCNFLNLPVQPLHLINGSIPTVNELQKIEDVINDLEVQQRGLLDEFYECRKEIASLIKELGTLPVLKHEVAACKENDSLFPPNKRNLEELKILKQKLISRLNSVKLEATELRDNLKDMWKRCKWNPSDLNRILNRHNGHSNIDISELKKELTRCEEEKRTHVKEFIMDVRDEISCYWDMLYFSAEDKKRFKHFNTTDYNEDVLIIHEVELENLKIHYKKYKNMYKLIETRRKLWDRLKTIEEATKDPDRLFKNRGGQLLQEEKERKMIQRELPKIEDSLLKCIAEYEQETRTPFSYLGHNMRGLIKAEWENCQASKDSEKKAKKIANLQEVESKQRTPNVASIKRKQPLTPKQINVSNKIPNLCGSKSQTILLKTSRLPKPVGQPKSATHKRLLTPRDGDVIPTKCCVSPSPTVWTPNSQS